MAATQPANFIDNHNASIRFSDWRLVFAHL
jgi:hypothetical protein